VYPYKQYDFQADTGYSYRKVPENILFYPDGKPFLPRKENHTRKSKSTDNYAERTNVDIGMVKLSDFEMKPVDWLWRHRLARKTLALVAGDGGVGKSQILLAIAAIVSRGGDW
jgi:predicted ATP-dependent serine protease